MPGDESSREVPMFPLNPVTLFPHLLVPLHIFEPRYYEMVTAALASDDLIAMAHYRDPRDSQAPGRPSLRPFLGIGRIARSIQLPDERYHLVLRGESRARLVSETSTTAPYRVGELERLSDGPVLLSACGELDLRSQLVELAAAVLSRQLEDGDRILREHIARPGIELGVLVDQVAATVPLSPEDRYELLAELDPVARCEQLIPILIRCRAQLPPDGPDGHLNPSPN